MEHDIIHHTETPGREPLTPEAADKLIAEFGQLDPEQPLEGWQKTVLRGILTGERFAPQPSRMVGKSTIRQALDRIEEARTHGLA